MLGGDLQYSTTLLPVGVTKKVKKLDFVEKADSPATKYATTTTLNNL